eukprot:15366266-Ditylum_brightwellii.AAC.2
MKKAESTKAMYRKFKTYLKPNAQCSLSQVDILEWGKLKLPVIVSIAYMFQQNLPLQWWLTMALSIFLFTFTEWKEHLIDILSYCRVVVKEEMEQALFDQHIQHFCQVESTPMASPYLCDLFVPLAGTLFGKKYWDVIANVVNLATDQYTTEFFQELQQHPNNSPPIDLIVNASTISENYKNWKERTSTSLEVKYLSLYKIWTHQKEKEEEISILTATGFFHTIVTIVSICQQYKWTLP